uniref:Uncharacterized protein n=1 Tax=Coccidioides posadasii RMSCC 3488 TaxID=454284 RepID=A0A0J6FMG5_COCPO|nr:hypothetical protein CPAG_06391 [Coccidioides posadasii RMSCC 3488]
MFKYSMRLPRGDDRDEQAMEAVHRLIVYSRFIFCEKSGIISIHEKASNSQINLKSHALTTPTRNPPRKIYMSHSSKVPGSASSASPPRRS